MKSYEMLRDAYRAKFPMEYTSLNYIPKDKSNDIFEYLFERKDLETYCHSENLYFPIPFFIKSTNTGDIYSAVELLDDKLFVFPPKTDIIFYKSGEKLHVIYADELLGTIDKYCYDLPGFIHNTKVLDKTGMKRIKKIINKTKFTEISDNFSNI